MPEFDDIVQVQGEVITPSQRIAELEEEIERLQGGGSGALARLLENPSQLKGLFQISDTQAQNVRALVTGAGTAMSVKYLAQHFGDVPAALMGAGLSAYLAKMLFGSSQMGR